MREFKQSWADAIKEMRDAGMAVTVFTTDELKNADAGVVEDDMVMRGWDAIDNWNHPIHVKKD